MILASGQLQTGDYVVLVGYFILMLGIGIYFYRYMRGIGDYFSGGNQIPWWLSGVSFYMSSFSAFTFVAYSELAFKHGFVSVTLYWVATPAVLIGAYFLSWRWRRARILSPVEYLEARYGLGIRQTFAWANIPVRVIDDGLRLLAIGLFVSGGLGLPLETSILLSGVIILAYTFMGGLWAVTVTDFLQFIVMMAGIALLVPLSLAKVGGFRGLVSSAPEGFFSLTDPGHPWGYVFVFFLLILLTYNTHFALVQRYYCVRDERDARRVGMLVAGMNIFGPPIFFLPAMAARQFLGQADPSTIYATICVTLLPVGTLGLIIAAMFSATMSALSSDYNVVASVLTNDVYRRLVNREASQKRLVLIGRLMTLLIGVIALGMALFIAANKGDDILFHKMVKLFSVAGPPIAIPMLAGLLWRRCTNVGALAGFLSGVAVGLVAFAIGMAENFITLATICVTLIVMIGVSMVLPAGRAERDRSLSFAERMNTPVETVDTYRSEEKAPSPFRVVGVSTILVGLLLLLILLYVRETIAFATNLGVGMMLLLVGFIMIKLSNQRSTSQEKKL
ncbi:MAG: sodium:solute symporter family transporter [Planctomycetota bacterium]|jgi:SSS family transporter